MTINDHQSTYAVQKNRTIDIVLNNHVNLVKNNPQMLFLEKASVVFKNDQIY